MTASALSPQALQKLHDFASQWGKIIARRAFGDDGPPLDVDLLTFEQAAQAAAQGLLEGTLSTLLELQAQALPDEKPCPDCQQPGRLQRQPRSLACRGGAVTYDEPGYFCPACRRDFFPPAAHPAPG